MNPEQVGSSAEKAPGSPDLGRPRCHDCVVAPACLPGGLKPEQVLVFEEAMLR